METHPSAMAKILVVDDNPKNIQVIANILTNAQYSVGYATNGTLALSTLHNANDYDLVLLDIDMPVMNGLEACKLMRSDAKLKNIPVIFLTAFTDTEKIVASFEAGAQDYVTKPFNTQELLARVKTHIELKKSKEILLDVNTYLEEQVIQRTEELSIAHEKLDKANIQLEQLDQAKTEFIHILSHEIRTPLNGIIGSLDLLMRDELPETTNTLVNILNKSVRRLEEFSYQTLDISNLRTNGAKALTCKMIDVNNLVSNCIKDLAEQIECKRISVNVNNQSIKNEIEGDNDFICKSLNIIVGNAIKHSSVRDTVLIETNSTDHMLVILVKDNGKGFSKEIVDHPFYPFSTGKEHVNQNIGLDLYFVKLVMDAHCGIIEIGNNNEGGAFVKLMFNK